MGSTATAVEVPAAAPEPVLGVDQLPGGAGVVGDVNSAGGCGAGRRRRPPPRADAGATAAAGIVDHGPEAVGIAGRDGDADLADEVVGGQAAGQLLPGVAAVGGFVQAAAGQVGRRVDRPWRTARGPQRSVEHARILGVDGDVDGADVVGIVRR